MTGLWMPAVLEDGNGNLDHKGGLLFNNSYKDEDTPTVGSYTSVSK